MVIKNLIVIFLAIASFVACSDQRDDDDDDEPITPPVVVLSEKNIPERMLTIDTRPDTLELDRPARHLFGKFFDRHAEFYVIDNPNKTLYNQPVKSITLYYLEGTLSKTKYTLEEDISDDLIASLGSFTIKGYDSLTRKLFQTEDIIAIRDHKKVLNKKLNNYELKWDRGEKFILMRVDKTEKKKRVEYIESLKSYESTFKSVEGASF
jgi:hypothetical protein